MLTPFSEAGSVDSSGDDGSDNVIDDDTEKIFATEKFSPTMPKLARVGDTLEHRLNTRTRALPSDVMKPLFTSRDDMASGLAAVVDRWEQCVANPSSAASILIGF